MKGTKFLLALWLSVAAFCLLQIVFGPGGMSATSLLENQKAKLAVRLADLQAENARLTARYESLKTSPDAVMLEARALGYFRPGEIPVRTMGGAEFRLPPEDPHLSRIPPALAGEKDTSLFFRLVWPLLFLIFWGAIHLIWWLRSGHGEVPENPENLPAVRASGTPPEAWSTRLDFFRK